MTDLRFASRHAAMSKLIRQRGWTYHGKKVWETSEDKVVRDLYPDYRAMGARLPHRSRRARAAALGIRRKKVSWCAPKVRRLASLFTTASFPELQAAFPGASIHALRHQAYKKGVQRTTFHLIKPTGNKLIDAVRKRAHDSGYTMSALDREVGAKGYFSGGCRVRRPDYRILACAIEFLDGDLVVEWRDQ